jgi:hypothetical protein
MPNTTNPHTLISSVNISRPLGIQHRQENLGIGTARVPVFSYQGVKLFGHWSGFLRRSGRSHRGRVSITPREVVVVFSGQIAFRIVPAEFLIPRTGSTGPLASLD